MNYQVAFTAKLKDHPTTSSAIIFQTMISNIGGGYNNRDGIFNCPKAGLYMFTASLTSYQNYYVSGYIMKNNKYMVQLYQNIGSGNYHPSVSTSVMFKLAIGDKVWVKGIGIKYHAYFSTFSGVLHEYENFSMSTNSVSMSTYSVSGSTKSFCMSTNSVSGRTNIVSIGRTVLV
ncbi:hypothetical protein KUTeg_015791 [Tegillarca granosa]|uniref:C1q domain-containing protein n=1 Tax=Tegillarca granosa TaxID=220873 RepID=A0ABQ9ETL4_TEGGR|nr:hypothetical protein KUTeg_015791 [Tegillarca granosa]